MDRQHLNEKLQVLQEELYATDHILQDNIDLRQRVNMDRESFPDAEIFMQDIGKSIMDATEIRDILINEIEVVEDEIFRETKIVTMQEFLAIHELDVDFSEATKFCTSKIVKKKLQQRNGRHAPFHHQARQALSAKEPCPFELSNKSKAENGRFLNYEMVWIYNTKIKNFMIPRYNDVLVASKYGYG